MLIFLGIPVFALEISMGQLFRKNSLEIWHEVTNHPSQVTLITGWCQISESLTGVGLASVLTTFWVSLYYNVIIAW